MSIKKNLYNICQFYIESRIKNIEDAMEIATESANGETKSSAGDKHETSRAMAHLEQEKCSAQLQEALKLKNTLQQIDAEFIHSKVGLGALIFTDQLNYYISIAAGKIEWEGTFYYAISMASPIAQKMLNKNVEDTFSHNNIEFKILKIE